MALTQRPLIVDGVQRGSVYILEKAGDEFPAHVHDQSTIHYTVVAFGAVKCIGRPEIEGAVLEAKPGGTIVNWKVGEPHGFVALTDGTTLVNILKTPGWLLNGSCKIGK